MIFGMKVKVQNQARTKTYLSAGLVCMVLALFFHVIGDMFQAEMAAQLTGTLRQRPSPEMTAWIRTCSTLSFVCLWIAVLMLFQATFQHRKALQGIG